MQARRQAPHSYKSAFNCVTAAVYNYITAVHQLRFPIENMYPMRHMLNLYSHKDYIVPHPPDDMLRQFLDRVGAYLDFPVLSDIDRAILFADEHLRQKGPLSVNVNLRYDILEPLPFDNDSWHYQLIAGRNDDGSFAMYDQFEDAIFIYPEERLRSAIDTDFNYRRDGQFTPFMLVQFHGNADRHDLLNQNDNLMSDLVAGIAHYPLSENIDAGATCIAKIKRFVEQKPDAEFLYRIMNAHLIIIKVRQTIIDYLIANGCNAPSALPSVLKRWFRYKDVLALTLIRRSRKEFERLIKLYEDVIRFECKVLQSAVQLQPSGVC